MTFKSIYTYDIVVVYILLIFCSLAPRHSCSNGYV